jgi:hypothetical protein
MLTRGIYYRKLSGRNLNVFANFTMVPGFMKVNNISLQAMIIVAVFNTVRYIRSNRKKEEEQNKCCRCSGIASEHKSNVEKSQSIQ